MNASTDSPQGQIIFPKGQNDRVLKTLIQTVNTTWNIQSAHLMKTSSTDIQHGQRSRDNANTSLNIMIGNF